MTKINPFFVSFTWATKLAIYFKIPRYQDVIDTPKLTLCEFQMVFQINWLCDNFKGVQIL